MFRSNGKGGSMRIAVYSDVHGNSIALDAVLGDIASIGVDEHWVIGDLVALGPDPAGAVHRLRALPDARFVRGNTDRYTMNGVAPPSLEDLTSPDKLREVIDIARNFAWTQGVVTAAGALDWLTAIPLEQRITLPDGSRVLLVHASPGKDDGQGITASMTDGELAASLNGCDADLVLVAHTHAPLDRRAGNTRVVNVGSVSNPRLPERRAMWTLLTADERGFRLESHFVAYDFAAVRQAFDTSRHPCADWLKTKFPD
jgi:predicted phosphodiesterase